MHLCPVSLSCGPYGYIFMSFSVKTLLKMDFSSCHRNSTSGAIDLKICN